MTTRRQILTTLPVTGAAFALCGLPLDEGAAHAQEARAPLEGHFHPRGKAPSEHTLKVLAEARTTLPFDDTRDLDEQARGLVARRADPRI
ncbi:MBL fold metallo-hydrolase, partial [Paracoccus sp. EF6]|nr:MBL fold metallo-hydrolase [Paracoccus sp. EF6]